MNDTFNIRGPAEYEAILRDSKEMNFGMPSDLQTGALLRTLAASKPNGSFLEIGTGTGLETAWLLDGMDLLFDDMLPQPNWPDDHPPKVEALLQTIDELDPAAFSVVKLCWYTGHIIITKK